MLDLPVAGRFCEQEVGMHGVLASPLSLAALAARVHERLGRVPQVIGDPAQRISRVAW